MKLIATSDLHGQLPRNIPKCDVLVIAGDVCPMEDHNPGYQQWWLDSTFRSWLKAQPAKHIIGIAGNHDFAFDPRFGHSRIGFELPWTYLLDSGTEIDGVKFWGSPWVPNLTGWAFYGDNARLKKVYDGVPEDTDIAIFHGPPKLLCDRTKGGVSTGPKRARHMLKRVKPKAYICGHIHEAFGREVQESSGVPVYNVSYVDETYAPTHNPVVIDEVA